MKIVNTKEKLLVELYSMYWDAIFICRHDTGVLYTNQVGGTCCSYPTIEGFAIPICVQGKEKDALCASLYETCSRKLGDWEELCTRTQQALLVSELDRVFEPLSKSNQEFFLVYAESIQLWFAEGWLPVQVRQDIGEPVGYGIDTPDKWPNDVLLKHIGGRWGVLTWG